MRRNCRLWARFDAPKGPAGLYHLDTKEKNSSHWIHCCFWFLHHNYKSNFMLRGFVFPSSCCRYLSVDSGLLGRGNCSSWMRRHVNVEVPYPLSIRQLTKISTFCFLLLVMHPQSIESISLSLEWFHFYMSRKPYLFVGRYTIAKSCSACTPWMITLV